jgi:predicted CXXCH cytochrome family protein
VRHITPALGSLVILAACGAAGPPARYVGSEQCGGCHEAEYRLWRTSAHRDAARPATDPTVRAAFDGRTVVAASVTATPARTEGSPSFLVEGDSGTEHAVAALVLGKRTLEQFLVRADGGRLQAFPLAYDPAAGEWFDVFPDGPAPGEWRHWRGPGANGNAQCLECHVTAFEKRFDAGSDTYATRWRELGVGCESCHGPGGEHADNPARHGLPWVRRQVGTEPCATCHALRVPISLEYTPGSSLADHFDLELLDSDAFWADGSLRGEAYEWTSFQMSRMARAGVVCQDCHEPHSGALRATGNALCTRCHEAQLDSPSHHHHAPTGEGASCAACHMPESVFMERDRRRDHAFTRPDPRRAMAIGARDACTACHVTETPDWAARSFDRWYGDGSEALRAQRALAVIIARGRDGDPGAADALSRLLTSELDEIRRASIARLMAEFPESVPVRSALIEAASDGSPWVRAAAVRALGDVDASDEARRVLIAATEDRARLGRVEAAFALRNVPVAGLPPADRRSVEVAFDEWVRAQAPLLDVPEAHFNAGVFWTARGDTGRAEASYRRAIALWPADPSPAQNLAMLLTTMGRTAEAKAELLAIVERHPRWPPAHFALGVLAEEAQEWDEAARCYEACLDVAPSFPSAALRLAAVYRASGNSDSAREWLEAATRVPASRAEALRQLVRLAYERGDRDAVQRWLPDALLSDPTIAAEPSVRDALGIRAAPTVPQS